MLWQLQEKVILIAPLSHLMQVTVCLLRTFDCYSASQRPAAADGVEDTDSVQQPQDYSKEAKLLLDLINVR